MALGDSDEALWQASDGDSWWRGGYCFERMTLMVAAVRAKGWTSSVSTGTSPPMAPGGLPHPVALLQGPR